MYFDQLTDLKSAVISQNINKVYQVLQINPELLNHPDSVETGFELLEEAINSDNDKLAEILIKSGADPNFNNPLDEALGLGSVKCVEVMLKNGARFIGPEWQKELSAVRVAFDRHSMHENDGDVRKQMLLLLLKYGLDVSFRDEDGKNLMHLFAFCVDSGDKDWVEITEILLDLGVPLDEPCRDEKS